MDSPTSHALFPLDATTLDGRTLEALYAVAYSFLELERLQDAVRAFRVMVRFAPTDERAWLGLGTCHEQLGDEDIAAELFGAGSLVSAPPSPRCLIALARLLRSSGDGASAEEHVAHALALCESGDDQPFAAAIRQEWGMT